MDAPFLDEASYPGPESLPAAYARSHITSGRRIPSLIAKHHIIF